jgi:hypothetical protein
VGDKRVEEVVTAHRRAAYKHYLWCDSSHHTIGEPIGSK